MSNENVDSANDNATVDVTDAPQVAASQPDPILDAFRAEFDRLRPTVEQGDLPSSTKANDPEPSLAAPPPLAGDFEWEPGALESFDGVSAEIGVTREQAAQIVSWYAMFSDIAAQNPDGALPRDMMEAAFKTTSAQMGLTEDQQQKLREFHDKGAWRTR